MKAEKIRIYKVNPGEPYARMWVADCPVHGRVAQYWAFGASAGEAQEHLRRRHRPLLLLVNPDRCGGISVNGQPPKCCEVHMAPWGHPKGLPVWGK